MRRDTTLQRSVLGSELSPTPYAELTQSATAIANNTFTTPNLTTTSWDNGVATCGQALADLTNDRLYLRRPGLWQLQAYASWAANGSGYRTVAITVNNGVVAPNVAYNLNNNFSGFFGTEMSTAALYYTGNSTDYAYLQVYQNSGGNLNCTVTIKAAWIGNYA